MRALKLHIAVPNERYMSNEPTSSKNAGLRPSPRRRDRGGRGPRPACFGASPPAAPRAAAASTPLIMESSPENAITDNFNPFVVDGRGDALGATR